jgi:hypothetical protein
MAFGDRRRRGRIGHRRVVDARRTPLRAPPREARIKQPKSPWRSSNWSGPSAAAQMPVGVGFPAVIVKGALTGFTASNQVLIRVPVAKRLETR